LTFIGPRAFAECLGLERILFPCKRVMLGDSVVRGCGGLAELDLGCGFG
jgi:hypothetical protein